MFSLGSRVEDTGFGSVSYAFSNTLVLWHSEEQPQGIDVLASCLQRACTAMVEAL